MKLLNRKFYSKTSLLACVNTNEYIHIVSITQTTDGYWELFYYEEKSVTPKEVFDSNENESTKQ